MMIRNWTLVSVFATLAVASWAQPPAQTPPQRPDAAKNVERRPPNQPQIPPTLNSRPPESRPPVPGRSSPATPAAKDQLVRPGQADSAPVQSRPEQPDKPDNARKRPTPPADAPKLSNPLPRGPERAPDRNPDKTKREPRQTIPDGEVPGRRIDVPNDINQAPGNKNANKPKDDSPQIPPANKRTIPTAPPVTPGAGRTPKASATPDISDALKNRNNDTNRNTPGTPVKTPVQDLPSSQDRPGDKKATPSSPVSPDATPFVPTDMPERLRRNRDNDNKPEQKKASPGDTPSVPPTAPPPGSSEKPDANTPAKPGETPPVNKIPGESTLTPAPSPTGAKPTESPESAKSPTPAVTPAPTTTPRITPVSGAPTPKSASPSPSPATTMPPPGAPAQTPSTDAGRKAVEKMKDRETIQAGKATKEDLNQAAQRLFEKQKEAPSSTPPAGMPPAPKLTPWVTPAVITGDKNPEEINSTTDKPVVVLPPPGATPTPTPAPDTIVVSDPSEIMDNIKNIPLAPTPPPAPTPGATPVATPPGVTPIPTNFRPDRGWVPYPGWRPPNNWNPPKGWTPPGGWSPPPGWRAPNDEWVRRLRRWGWSYIANRGWVVPVQWTPPPDFRVPPDWYYLPSSAYNDYGFYDPSEVVVFPGRARPDLQVNINVNQVYMPPKPPPVQVVNMPPPPPRPAPPEPPRVPEQVTSVETVAQILTRPRDPNAPRYQGPVLVTGSVHFDFDSYAIRPDSFPTLDAIGQALVSELPDAIINVEGHTDSKGTDEYNQTLSEQRAWSVKSYLVQKFGLDPNRLIIVGYGERAPIADNATDAGRARNRRVEFENVTDLYKAQVVDTTVSQ